MQNYFLKGIILHFKFQNIPNLIPSYMLSDFSNSEFVPLCTILIQMNRTILNRASVLLERMEPLSRGSRGRRVRFTWRLGDANKIIVDGGWACSWDWDGRFMAMVGDSFLSASRKLETRHFVDCYADLSKVFKISWGTWFSNDDLVGYIERKHNLSTIIWEQIPQLIDEHLFLNFNLSAISNEYKKLLWKLVSRGLTRHLQVDFYIAKALISASSMDMCTAMISLVRSNTQDTGDFQH